MKKIEREVMRLSKQLPDIDVWQFDNGLLEDMELSIIDYYSYNGSYYCNGKRIQSYREPEETYENARVICSFGGYRVDRYVWINCHKRSINAFPKYYLKEVAQVWDNGKDRATLKRINTSNIDDCFVDWNWRTRLSVRDNNEVPTSVVCSVVDSCNDLYEIAKIDKCYGSIYKATKDIDLVERAIIDDRVNKHIVEYLAKTRQKRMLKYYLRNNMSAINEFLHSIKIAHRHHYRIRNIESWFSYLHKVARLGLDTHNPYYICPTNLMVAKKNVNRRIKAIELQKAKQKAIEKARQRIAENESYLNDMKAYLGITFSSTDGTIKFRVLQNIEEFVKEGQHMHNCIGGHYHNHSSLYMIAFDAKSGEHLANVEISLKDFSIKQCYAPCNKISERDKDLRDTLMQNMHLIKMVA